MTIETSLPGHLEVAISFGLSSLIENGQPNETGPSETVSSYETRVAD